MAELTATVTCTAFGAVEEVTGELVPARLLAERVGLLAALTQHMTAAVVAARWNDGDLTTLGSRVGPDGRALPAKGWMALRRLGWASVAPEGVYLPDRVRRVAEEAAARALRLAVHRRAVVHAIVGSCRPIRGGGLMANGQRCAGGSRKEWTTRRSVTEPGRSAPTPPTTAGGCPPA